MNKQFTWKFALVAAVAIVAFINMWPPKEKIRLGLDLKGGTSFLLKMDMSNIDQAGRGTALQQAIDILRRRVDKFGVAEPVIQPVGEDRILVQLPGLAEGRGQEARRTIEQTAYLEFLLVHADNDRLQVESTSPHFRPPVGYTNLTETVVRDGREVSRSYFVKLKPEQGLTGKYVQRAYVSYDDLSRPFISLEFNKEGAAIFARVTAANVGRALGIVLDGQLQSAPVIQDEIIGGRAQITGDFSLAEAQRLSSILENPLQAPVKVLEERRVDPSLGRDSIQSGIRAGLIGAVAVILFMAIYYLAAGVIADLALALNILIIVGALGLMESTLTLPGIAGIVLTIGMAVDANVLIYERIREELAANKGLRASVLAGYKRAFIVIFDSNFTTIMTAIILMYLGSGPVKGFGVTLTIGLVANLFAAVFVTRLIFEWLIAKGWLKSINMLHFFKHVPRIQFLRAWPIAFALSWAVILAGGYSFFKRGGLDLGKGHVYGIDFAGGDTVTLGYTKKIDVDQMRATLERGGFTEAYIQYASGGGSEELQLKLPENLGEKVSATLIQAFPDAGLHVLSTERVGAIVGAEMLKQALIAVAISLAAIMIYVAFRFGEFAYGLGALVSLMHDILMTVGLFCLTGRTFSMPVVAALLTLIGYSINDTIVVFDRIRENKKLTGGKLNYYDLINRSVNETLSRTFLTAGTVFLTSVALYGFGGRVINDFAFCFMVGVVTGTYSSIYIASPVVLWYHRNEAKRPSALSEKPTTANA